MYNVIIDKTKVIKKDDKYVYDTHYNTEMGQKEYDEIIKKFKNQIKTAEKIISLNNPEDAVKKEAEKLKQQLVADKEAYKNYDKLFEEELKQLQDTKEQKRKELKERIDNHLKIKETLIKNIRKRKELYIEGFQFQLQQDKKLLSLYENLGEIDNKQNE